MNENYDIAVMGLAVMGQNLILNMNDHGYRVIAYNRTSEKTHAFLKAGAANTQVAGADSLPELVSMLSKPRKIMLMIKAGDPVDSIIASLIPLLDPGDVIIDGGNSNFQDSQRRADWIADENLLYIGIGVSGGEEGARNGPSLMPGGHEQAWPIVRELFQSIAAKTPSGEPCCDWVGKNGSGHFVKMVHNGIEYGDMQLICESYHFMGSILQMDNSSMQAVFKEWNRGDLESYLIEITADILGFQENGSFVVDTILDKAGQKGTGKWTGINALDLGIPLSLIGEAVFARCLSAIKEERVRASNILTGPIVATADTPSRDWIAPLGQALLASKIISYAQGYMLLRAASDEYGWSLNFGAIAQMWRSGCIIRSVFLEDIKTAYDNKPDLDNLLLDQYFSSQVQKSQSQWRTIISKAIECGIPMPAMSSALAFYDGYRTAQLPANLLQAQRDYFGAHGYQRLDGDGSFVHTDWTGSSIGVASHSYNV